MFTRKPRLQLEKFAINGAKRLLQHNLPIGDIFILPERASPLAQAFLLVAEQRRQEIAQDHARSGLDQSIFFGGLSDLGAVERNARAVVQLLAFRLAGIVLRSQPPRRPQYGRPVALAGLQGY